MRKIISVIMVLVLGVALVGSSAYAVNPDPNAVRPWICEVRPDPGGDDSGWNDLESPGLKRRPLILSGSFLELLWRGVLGFVVPHSSISIQPNNGHYGGKYVPHPQSGR